MIFKILKVSWQKQLQQFQPNLHNDRDHQVVTVGGPICADKSKMADGRHFEKTVKVTDSDEIRHDEADWPPDWAAAAILKIIKKMVWPIFAKFGMTMQNWSCQKSEFEKLRVTNVCHLKSIKSPRLCSHSTDFDEIWQNQSPRLNTEF